MSKEALKKMYQLLLTEPHAPTVCAQLEEIAREALAQPERHELQAKGKHPAPCARHCEANAFQIVTKNLKAQLAQPEQEPVWWMSEDGEKAISTTDMLNYPDYEYRYSIPLYTSPPQRTWVGAGDLEDSNSYLDTTPPPRRKTDYKAFMEWASKEGYDTAYTVNSDNGKFMPLNPMTADLWKAWQAAHGIK